MTTEKRSRLTVITNNSIQTEEKSEHNTTQNYHSNPIYQKLLNFRNLQNEQKKRFTVEDLLKW